MPKLSGYEVCAQLKKDPETRSIPILMITALKEMGDIEKALAAGADDFSHQARPSPGVYDTLCDPSCESSI